MVFRREGMCAERHTMGRLKFIFNEFSDGCARIGTPRGERERERERGGR